MKLGSRASPAFAPFVPFTRPVLIPNERTCLPTAEGKWRATNHGPAPTCTHENQAGPHPESEAGPGVLSVPVSGDRWFVVWQCRE